MNKYKYIDLQYFIDSGLDEVEVINEILATTEIELQKLLDIFESYGNPKSFNEDKLYFIFHKFKPTAIMYNLESRPYFEKYGSNSNKLDYTLFEEIKPEIISNLQNTLVEISEILQKASSQN